MASKEQRDLLWNIASKHLGWTAEQLQDVIKGEYRVSKSADLTSAQALELIGKLRAEVKEATPAAG